MRLVFLTVFVVICFKINAQRVKPDSIWYEKKHFNYVSVQANLLLQQFISFNSNSSINSNPYLLTFATNDKYGGGFAMGTGFSVTQSSTNDGVAAISVQNNNVSLRIGYEKKYLQRQKFIPFWGVDMGAGFLNNKTTSTLNQSFNNSTTTIETTKWFFGPALRGGVYYALTRHILFGTEFFINAQIAFTQTQTDNSGFRTSSSTTVPFNVGVQAPTALFLVFRY